jgi:hypothetical protein
MLADPGLDTQGFYTGDVLQKFAQFREIPLPNLLPFLETAKPLKENGSLVFRWATVPAQGEVTPSLSPNAGPAHIVYPMSSLEDLVVVRRQDASLSAHQVLRALKTESSYVPE